mmetsp:Transcript_71878/g.126649  ORF Transcript_71878/g.126649 Transcript_71878/m.126649 type:complete len:322 (+) Transcript_71878:444-1409(+)
MAAGMALAPTTDMPTVLHPALDFPWAVGGAPRRLASLLLAPAPVLLLLAPLRLLVRFLLCKLVLDHAVQVVSAIPTAEGDDLLLRQHGDTRALAPALHFGLPMELHILPRLGCRVVLKHFVRPPNPIIPMEHVQLVVEHHDVVSVAPGGHAGGDGELGPLPRGQVQAVEVLALGGRVAAEQVHQAPDHCKRRRVACGGQEAGAGPLLPLAGLDVQCVQVRQPRRAVEAPEHQHLCVVQLDCRVVLPFGGRCPLCLDLGPGLGLAAVQPTVVEQAVVLPPVSTEDQHPRPKCDCDVIAPGNRQLGTLITRDYRHMLPRFCVQ